VITLPLPEIPREVIVSANACPTKLAKSEVGLCVMCACPTALTGEEQVFAQSILAKHFPPEATFEFYWALGPIDGLSPREWFARLLEETYAFAQPP